MAIVVEQQVWEKFPGLKIGILIAKGIDNSGSEGLDVLRATEKGAQKQYGEVDLNEVDKLKDWREAYRSFGYKPAKARCSVDALLRRVVKGKELPNISPLVNLYNSISLKHSVPAGADDLDKVEGSVRLTVAKGDETFRAIGAEEAETALSGEIIYRDDAEITCKAWNYRECDKTKITAETKNAALVIEGLEHTSLFEVARALEELKMLVEKHCGGQFKMYLLDADHPEMGEGSLLENRTIPVEIPEPDYHSQEAYQTRLGKLHEIQELGIDPYPAKFMPTNVARDLISKYEGQEIGTYEEAAEGKTDDAKVAGRILLFRPMGANIFAQILDETSKIQVLFNKEHTKVTGLGDQMMPIKFIEKKLDLGDIIGVSGFLFRTQKGELTLFAKEITLLCKTLLPLPDKHKGIADKGTRYRKRWLDLIANPEVGEQLRLRSQLVAGIRKYFADFGFMEVETPVLQNIYGGASAKPFITHHNALSQDMYCRIALEIALKKLVVGGMNKVYEIGKVFRNEGIDKTHNPEFTMLEAYAAYWDYNDVMTYIENLYEKLALDVFGTTCIGKREDKKGNSYEIDFKTPWIRMTMKEAINNYGKIDVDALSDEEMKTKLKPLVGPEKLKDLPRGLLIAMLFEEFAEEHLIQPHHITDHPIETTPLCKLHRDPKERAQGIVERFETFILGMECCNAYTELNDPVLQRELLVDQAKLLRGGDEEANPLDEEFIEAICQGMPPTGGFGIGIDRLCMLFTGVNSIRDVLFFPVMRPEE
ncbi:MAG: lysine--tRNA ligase [Simkaniaceae bacterium]|nr:lysine--tRNA ligase [Candidatus Sacchlamyda saccharinae]